jgi:pre-mycofactocin synthase
VLDLMHGGIDSALRGLGKASVHDLVAGDVLMPPDFVRALGVPDGAVG